METILICPGERAAVSFLAQTTPLAALPILGEPLVNHWLAHLATAGAQSVTILATDRPEAVAAAADDGARWGLRARVEAELRELTPEEVELRFPGPRAVSEKARVAVLDHFPGMESFPLFVSYRGWFEAALARLERPAMPGHVGLREIRPQVWCSRRARIARGVRLQGPCWIGEHVQVSNGAAIGPDVILEDRVVVSTAAEIRGSIVGPDTYVGALTRLSDSLAWGSTLINWRTNSCTQAPDPFLLCALRPQPARGAVSAAAGLVNRITAALTRPFRGGRPAPKPRA